MTYTVLHLGLGSFHRAHQAVYFQALHDQGQGDWRLCSGNIRNDNPALLAALIQSQGCYTLETVSPQNERSYQWISAISKVLPFDESLAPLIAVGADPATRIISFTVTEAGYYLNSQHGLDEHHPEIHADAEKWQAGRAGSTLYGALAAILRQRRANGAGPLTLLNCDNLRHNGERARSGLLQFLRLVKADDLADWVEDNSTSPNAMVDRITPRPLPEVAQRVQQATGRDDPAALMAERFLQWVIEDDFKAGRPPWEEVGVQMVDSVLPFEEAKIRLLNATHSCIAWAGTLIGCRYIHESLAYPAVAAFAYRYVSDDAIPALSPSPINLGDYRDMVLARFSNSAIADTNQRVAMDGFSKIPGFIAPTIRERLQGGHSIAAVAVLPALFLAYLQRWVLGQIPYEYQDQAMDAAEVRAVCAAPDPVAAFAALPQLWGELAAHPTLLAALRNAHQRVQVFIATGGRE